MQIRTLTLIALLSVLATGGLSAREDKPQNADTWLLARLSYRSTWTSPPGQKVAPRICLSVSKDGQYRILRLSDIGQTQVLQGTLTPGQLKQLQELLDAPDFRALAGSHGGVVRRGSESFMAEVPREEGVQRVLWMIPDRKSGFPQPAARMVEWLRDFQPNGAETLINTEFPDVCPRVGLAPVQPTVAHLDAQPGDSCTNDAESVSPGMQ
jgi:hypothetical protein